MLHRTNSCPIAAHQKLLVYRAAICPHLSWLLMVQEFPITWVRNELKAVATHFLKKWSGLACTANTAILYKRQSSGGINLPSITTFYKKLQVSRQCQLLTCPDPCVRRIAEQNLQCQEKAVNRGFRPAVEVREAMRADPGGSTKKLKKRATAIVLENDNGSRPAGLTVFQGKAT